MALSHETGDPRDRIVPPEACRKCTPDADTTTNGLCVACFLH